MNVFMCTGYTRDTHQYFMKASPVRPGDFIEFFAEIDLLVALSACPGGDYGTSHSDDIANCYPLKVGIHQPREGALADWQSPPPNKYSRSHWNPVKGGDPDYRLVTMISDHPLRVTGRETPSEPILSQLPQLADGHCQKRV
jgi:hypothetical protein